MFSMKLCIFRSDLHKVHVTLYTIYSTGSHKRKYFSHCPKDAKLILGILKNLPMDYVMLRCIKTCCTQIVHINFLEKVEILF